MSDPIAPTPTPTTPPAAPAAAAPVASTAEPTTFSAEYVRELRAENKAWRLKAQENEATATSAAEAAKKAKDIFFGSTGTQAPPTPTGDAAVIDPSKIKFNLPPHNSSLPIDPY